MPTSLTIIVAVLALFVAMVALWMVSDIIKKVETRLEGFVHTYITPIHDEILKANQLSSKVVKEVEVLTKRVDTFDILAGRINKVAEDLDKLDRAIPQRYRTDVTQPTQDTTKPKK